MQGQEKAKEAGKHIGRPENKRRNTKIATVVANGASYSDVQDATGCSRATVAKIAKRVRAAAQRLTANHRAVAVLANAVPDAGGSWGGWCAAVVGRSGTAAGATTTTTSTAHRKCRRWSDQIDDGTSRSRIETKKYNR